MIPRPTRPRGVIAALVLACGLASALAAAAPAAHGPRGGSGVVRGRIVGAEGRNPWVIIVGKGSGAPVDSNGRFEFESLPAGRHAFLFRGYYCDDATRTVTVRAGAVDTLLVELRCSKVPCPKPDRADPECILRDPYEASRVGKPCELHGRRLRRDVVPIQYGIVGCSVGDDPNRFPNARLCRSGGCVIGREQWAEVAYCDECRAAYYWANPLRVLAPPKSR